MTQIHPSSVVDPKAELAADVQVGPLCHIGPGVTIGTGTQLISHVVVLGPTVVGALNMIWPQTTLGGDPQDLKYRGEPTRLIIGDHNQIRESVTMHRGTANDNGVTTIGDYNLIMAYAHVAHDCLIGNHVVIANGVALAGHIQVEDFAAIGGESAVHHFVTIGGHAYVGGMCRVVTDVPPYMLVEGSPAKVRGINSIGLTRHAFPVETVGRLKEAYKRLFRDAAEGTRVGQMSEGLAQVEKDYPDDPAIVKLVGAVRNASVGVHGRYRESLRADDRRRANQVSP
jgi:UDP-N-acetylglucosamine acyltransferase